MRLLGTAALQKLKNAAKFHVSTFPASFEIFGISGMVTVSYETKPLWKQPPVHLDDKTRTDHKQPSGDEHLEQSGGETLAEKMRKEMAA
uniref:Uncharacterized protein n=1 Tax=Ascaris lumbricoides TaxID=6252 RepID=A0A0M3I2X8_ASCLU